MGGIDIPKSCRKNCGLGTSTQRGGLPGDSESKESACNAGDPGSIPGSGRSTPELKRSPEEVNVSPLELGEFHGHRNLVDCSPWGPKRSDRTEQLTLSLFHLHPEGCLGLAMGNHDLRDCLYLLHYKSKKGQQVSPSRWKHFVLSFSPTYRIRPGMKSWKCIRNFLLIN